MTNATISGLRSVELGVPDLDRSSDFYQKVWGLQEIAAEGDTIYLRGTGAEHHLVALRQRPKAALLAVHFSASDRVAVAALHAKAQSYGTDGLTELAELPRAAGGGYGFRFRTPEGLPMAISANVAQHGDVISDRSRPTKLTHVVLNSAAIDDQTSFFKDLLGFRHSDSTDMMEFIRCCADHHSIAFARGNGASLNHMAYEMPNFDGLMRGAGRMKQAGFNIEWGVGRHGPGNNIFTYFVEPNGFVTEYTTEVEQVDEATYVPNTAEFWRNFPGRPCRWNMAGHPSNRLKAAMSGELLEGMDIEGAGENLRCEEVMARTLGR
jgi:catechol 2,3-dioxygenase-like lactoylglutathione lyase family enzyme